MKKASKLVSVILAGIMLFSIFTISASAEEMTASEVVKLYHNILKETAEKNKMIQVKEECDGKFTPDLSELSGLDLKLTKELFVALEELDIFGDGESYYYGVCGEYEEPTDTEIYERFNLSWELEWGYEIKNAVYADNKIVIELEDDQDYYDIKKITIELTDENVIKKITEEVYEEIEDESLIKKVPFTITNEETNIYTFVYEEVPATSLTLSETNITLGYEDVAEITYTVGPEDATFKGVYVYDAYNEDYETIAYAYEENGKIIIEAWGEGTGTIEIYTYSGDVLATCEVTVEYTIWDRIRSIFDDMFFWIGLIFGI